MYVLKKHKISFTGTFIGMKGPPNSEIISQPLRNEEFISQLLAGLDLQGGQCLHHRIIAVLILTSLFFSKWGSPSLCIETMHMAFINLLCVPWH
jgi:hypothetical protein